MKYAALALLLLVACHVTDDRKPLGMGTGPDPTGSGFNVGLSGVNQLANFNCPDAAAPILSTTTSGTPICIAAPVGISCSTPNTVPVFDGGGGYYCAPYGSAFDAAAYVPWTTSQGGTGLTSVGAAGQAIVSTGTGLTYSTLSQSGGGTGQSTAPFAHSGGCQDGGRPAATGSGGLYVCNDLPVAYLDQPDAAAWIQIAIEPQTAGPAGTAYTMFPTSNAFWNSATQMADGVEFQTALNTWPMTLEMISQTLSPTATWQIVGAFHITPQQTQYPTVGLGVAGGLFTDASVKYMAEVIGTGVPEFGIYYGNANTSSMNNNAGFENTPYLETGGDGWHWFRILNDGWETIFEISNDHGQTWVVWGSAAAATYADYGWVFGNPGATQYGEIAFLVGALSETSTLNVPPCTITGYLDAGTSGGLTPAQFTAMAGCQARSGDYATFHSMMINQPSAKSGSCVEESFCSTVCAGVGQGSNGTQAFPIVVTTLVDGGLMITVPFTVGGSVVTCDAGSTGSVMTVVNR